LPVYVESGKKINQFEVSITGSSAQMLAKEIATQMRGRALSWELFPFSFLEFLDYKNFAYRKNLSTKHRLVAQKAFEEYLNSGGFPEVLSANSSTRVRVH
jgi:predicted AAA+ superfamily ATPase